MDESLRLPSSASRQGESAIERSIGAGLGQDPDVPPNIPEKGENKLDFKDNLPGNTTDLERIRPIDLEHEMKKSFISYAMAVIITRALPDVRDGLKPVHRRILYAMHELGVTPDKPYRKCARIVGDVLGKYHPHGDSSVYGALVRLGQDFATRYPLVDGQGNFGSVDGDGAAAMRYTEARMSKINLEMLADIDKETVDFSPNFDETLMQPNVLPSRFPNLLVNGSSGIAVGMATNIPPHNLGEVIDGVVKMIENPDVTTQELMECIKGPDFPTGGIILGRKGIYDTYATGRGRIITRAKTEVEPMQNGRQRIVVTEIPYMVNKAMLVAKIAELVHDKRLEGISDIRDESDTRRCRNPSARSCWRWWTASRRCSPCTRCSTITSNTRRTSSCVARATIWTRPRRAPTFWKAC